MKTSLMRAAVAASLITPTAAIAFWFLLTSGAEPSAERSSVVPLMVALLLGGIVGVAGAVVTFLFSRFPRSARVAAIFATGLCLVLAAISVFDDVHRGQVVEPQSVFMWLILWPFAFGASLWVDLRRALAKAVLDSVARK